MLKCYLCNRVRDSYNIICDICIDFFDNIVENFEDDDEVETTDEYIDDEAEKYNTDDYDIFYYQRKRIW